MSNLTVFQPQISPLWTIINLLLSIGVVSSLSTLIRLDSLNVLGLSPTLNNSLKLLFHHTIAETVWYDKRFTFLIAYIRTIVVAKFQQISIKYDTLTFNFIYLFCVFLYPVKKIEEKETKPIRLSKTDHSRARIITGSVHLEYDPTEK